MAATLPLMKYRIRKFSSGFTNSSIKSGSSMEENPAHLVVHLLARPAGMLVTEEGDLVPACRPVEAMRSPPALLRRHAAQQFELFRRSLFVGQHGANLPQRRHTGKPF